MSRRPSLLGSFVLLLLTGCTHNHLRHSFVHQAATLNDVYYEQVLDNLAMYTVTPSALPHFAVPNGGLAQVDSAGQSSLGFEWDPAGLASTMFGVNGERRVAENWNLLPVSDPDRLKRIRCAFQVAIGMHDLQTGPLCSGCVDCCQLFNEWYGGENAAPCCVDPCHIPGPGWYCVGCEDDVPDDALYVGEYEDRYVWVTRRGLEELSRLTLAVLDFASNDLPAPNVEVETFYRARYDDEGKVIGYRAEEVRVRTLATQEPTIKDLGKPLNQQSEKILDVPPAATIKSQRTPTIIQPFAIPLNR